MYIHVGQFPSDYD